MKIKKVKFNKVGFRKLNNFEISISPRITVIAGHNGIGKSTILGLIANCSELSSRNLGLTKEETKIIDIKTLTGHLFKSDFSEIFFLHYLDDLESRPQGPSEADLVYDVNGIEVVKECAVSIGQKRFVPKKSFKPFMKPANPEELTPRQIAELTEKNKNLADSKNEFIYVHRPRIIPRTVEKNLDAVFLKENRIGKDAKMPIPTLYVGMSRVSPIGEFEWTYINHTILNSSPNLQQFVYKVFKEVLPFSNENTDMFTHSFAESNKRSIVPNFGHSTLTISLGQDSLSSIVTAIASFYKLKENLNERYKGGILVIDEIEAGLHPRAQERLIKQIKKYAHELDLQVIMTTHSLSIISEILENSNFDSNKDSVIYLVEPASPYPMDNVTYLKVKNDMLISKKVNLPEVPVQNPKTNIYFEDLEAFDLMNGILDSLGIKDTYSYFGRELELVSASLGSTNLLKLCNSSPHFMESIVILDADIEEEPNKQNDKLTLLSRKNVITLPLTDPQSIYDKLPPDKAIYIYLLDKFQNIQNNNEFWRNKTESWFNSSYYIEHIRFFQDKIPETYDYDMIKSLNRKVTKKWYLEKRGDLLNIGAFRLWAKEHEEACKNFVEKLAITLSLIYNDNN